MVIFVIIGLWISWSIFSWIREAFDNSKKYLELKPELDSLNKQKEDFERKKQKEEADMALESQKITQAKDNAKKDLERIAKQKSMGFPWLAEAYAEYFTLRDLRREDYLLKKNHPALTAAETVREIRQEKRQLLKENKITTYRLTYFEKLFPWLSDLIAETEDEEIPVKIEENISTDNEDSVRILLTPEEYSSLSSGERNQIALDRYILNRNKSKWAIGRDYEMYVGYLYEQKGYKIHYKGILDGFDDLGRDVIATKDGEICIIQCKYWAQYKNIHEKHIFQLFGTTMEYWLNYSGSKQKTFEEFSRFLNQNRLRPIFYTSTKLSGRAREMAETLSIEVLENRPIGNFPRIKCNINIDESGVQTKIYHLPMDQQYDRTVVGNRSGEFYAATVKEAEDAGFRRAHKHRF